MKKIITILTRTSKTENIKINLVYMPQFLNYKADFKYFNQR